MGIFKSFAVAASAAAILFAPLPAAASGWSDAEDLRRLDIMLMVTSLRCRTGVDNFQPQYRSFTANHIATLNSAARRLEAGLVNQHGSKGAKRALDRISVGMANEYGQGHPWLECTDLKRITSELAASRNPADLQLAAVELLALSPSSGGRYAVD